MKRNSAVLWISVIIALFWAHGNGAFCQPVLTELPNGQLWTHRNSDITLSVTNYGTIGSFKGRFIDPETSYVRTPGAEFPARSYLEYLNVGALWVGATIDTVDGNGNAILDTLVSVGNDGWWTSMYELIPPNSGQSIRRDQINADDEIFAIYSDTCTDPSVVIPDPVDSLPHIPLGIVIRQHTMCWTTPGYDDFIILEYTIENIYNRPLHDVWAGIFYDGDIFYRPDRPNYWPEPGTGDELCGSIKLDSSRIIAWTADNDGRPEDGFFGPHSPRNVIGLMLLHPQNGVNTNYNWWFSTQFNYDWGPRRIENGSDPFPGRGMGTPGGDRAKYKVMSNGERDYDQIWSAIPQEGWIPPTRNSEFIAHGIESRFLISAGPFQLAAGQIETVTVALVGGHNLHVDPKNYTDHLRHHETDSSQITQYYQNLDFSDLIARADSVYAYYGRNYAYIPPESPRNLHVADWTTSQINLAWSPSWHPQVGEYRLYRLTTPRQYERITPDGFTDTTFADTGLHDNTWYHYVISTVTSDGVEGARSREMAFNSGRPHIPENLTAIPGNNHVELSWQANPGNDIDGYVVYWGLDGQPLFNSDTAETTSYTVHDIRNGITYDFSVAAYDTYGNESDLSPRVTCTPMGFDSGILVINMNSLGQYNPDSDSMIEFYRRALAGYNITFMEEPPSSLVNIAPYSTVIWSRELIPGNSFATGLNMGIFGRYLECGGKLIIEGTRNLVGDPWFEDTISFADGDFRYDQLNLAGALYPDTTVNTEFVGAWTDLPGFPVAEVDTARANRIVYPINQNDGRLFGIGTIIPRSSYEVLYTFTAVNPDTSRLHGNPVATIHMGPNYILAAFEFPLYYIREPASIEILHRILGEFGELGIAEEAPGLPGEVSLRQNYPNPFNARTNICFALPTAGDVRLDIYNILGERVATAYQGYMTAGQHNLVWNADRFSSGIYLAKLESAKITKIIKMVLLK